MVNVVDEEGDANVGHDVDWSEDIGGFGIVVVVGLGFQVEVAVVVVVVEEEEEGKMD